MTGKFVRKSVSADRGVERLGLMLEGANAPVQYFDPGLLSKDNPEMILVMDNISSIHHSLKLVLHMNGLVIYVQQYGEARKGGWTMDELPKNIQASLGGVRYRVSVITLGANSLTPVEVAPIDEEENSEESLALPSSDTPDNNESLDQGASSS
jgi:hypothetical protein